MEWDRVMQGCLLTQQCGVFVSPESCCVVGMRWAMVNPLENEWYLASCYQGLKAKQSSEMFSIMIGMQSSERKWHGCRSAKSIRCRPWGNTGMRHKHRRVNSFRLGGSVDPWAMAHPHPHLRSHRMGVHQLMGRDSRRGRSTIVHHVVRIGRVRWLQERMRHGLSIWNVWWRSLDEKNFPESPRFSRGLWVWLMEFSWRNDFPINYLNDWGNRRSHETLRHPQGVELLSRSHQGAGSGRTLSSVPRVSTEVMGSCEPQQRARKSEDCCTAGW